MQKLHDLGVDLVRVGSPAQENVLVTAGGLNENITEIEESGKEAGLFFADVLDLLELGLGGVLDEWRMIVNVEDALVSNNDHAKKPG